MSKKTLKTKYAATITYVIILGCMIASLFIPVFDGDIMLFREIPGALGAVIGRDFSLSGFFVPFGLTSYYGVNLAALAVVIYAVLIVLSVIAFLSTLAMDGDSRAAVVITYILEILAMLTLLLFAYDRLTLFAMGGFSTLKANGQTGGILFVVLAAVWLMYTIQSVCYKKGAGFAKSILFILSLAGLLCLFLSNTVYSAGWINTLADWLKASYYFIGDYAAFALLGAIRATFKLGATYIAAFITSVIVLVNVIVDTFSIAVNSNKLSKTFNLARYGLELVAAIVTAILGAVNSIAPGIYLYALMVIALAQIVISTIRMFTRATFEESVEYGYDYGAAEQTETKAAAPAVAETETKDDAANDGFYEAADTTPVPPPVYTRAYSYQDDGFLNSLSPSERAEFYAIFIDKRRGNFYFLPEYEIGGENVEFFQSMFIYLGKIMGNISDGLMNKIYRRLNMIT